MALSSTPRHWLKLAEGHTVGRSITIGHPLWRIECSRETSHWASIPIVICEAYTELNAGAGSHEYG